MTKGNELDSIIRDLYLIMSIKGNEENKNSFVKIISWWLILVPALIGVRFLIV